MKMERELCEVLRIAGAIDDDEEQGGSDPCWIRYSPTSWYLASHHREVPCNPLHALETHTQQNKDPLESRFQPPSSSLMKEMDKKEKS